MHENQAPVATSVMVRYGAGQLGAQIFRDTPAVLLPIFMTTMLGVPAWLAGLVILVPKLWVIVCDPLVGAYSDRLKARYGRTPFLLIGGISTSLCFAALFTITKYPSPTIAALSVCVLFFIASTSFSIFSVPYLAVASELSSDTHERTRIMVWRMVFTIVGVLLGVGVAQPLIQWMGGGVEGWHAMAYSFALICLVSMMVTALGLRSVKLLPGSTEKISLINQIKPAFANRPYMVLVSASFIQNIAQAASYTVFGFIFIYVIDAVWIIPFFVLSMSFGSIISQPLWLKLSRSYGKAPCYVFCSLAWAAITATWFWMEPGSDVLFTLPGVGPVATEHFLIIVRGVLIGLTNSGFVLLALSMMTDTIDYQRRQHGVAHEGIFSGLYSASEKLAFAMGPLLAGVVMSAYGFSSSTEGLVQQTDDALLGILLLYSLIPAFAQIISLLVFSRFKIPAVTQSA